MKVKSLSHIRLFATPWTVAHQAPPSMEFSRQEYWSGLPFPSPYSRFSTSIGLGLDLLPKKKKIVDEKQVALSKENRRKKEMDPAHDRVGCGGSVFEKRVV